MSAMVVEDRRAWVSQIMGMPVSVHLRGPGASGPAAEEAVRSVFDHLRGVDAVFSTYRPDSDVCRLDRGEVTLGGCDPTVTDVRELCAEAVRRTAGWFDAVLPASGGGSRWDPSGLVKGWAVEQASRALAGVDAVDFCLNAGGDVVLGTGTVDLRPWRVGIEDPDDPARMLAVVEAHAGGVATSGTARRGHHILDPHTGRPATALRSVTVVGPSLMWADVFATAAVARGPSAAWIDGLAGYEGLLVATDGSTTTTAGWPPAAAGR
jgi:thiamine biosynthesis lipoprotein